MARRGLCVAVLLGLLCACSGLERSPEYRSAREAPPLVLPPSADARPIKPLFPIPPGPVLKVWPEKFQVPAPKPLVLAETPVPDAAAVALPVAEKPVLTQDGNGYPLISIAGDFNAIWDRLGEALHRAGVKVSDRDQRTGLYYLNLDDETGKGVPYQLRLSRGQSSYTLTLQKDDETLAPKATTQALFETIVNRWPELAVRE